MSWTLEAVLVVPLSIGLTALCVAYAAPLYRDAWRAARLEVKAAVQRTSLNSLYQAERLSVDDGVWTLGLQTSPRMILEMSSLLEDDIRLLSNLFPGIESPDANAAVQYQSEMIQANPGAWP